MSSFVAAKSNTAPTVEKADNGTIALRNVELLRTGTWPAASGEVTFTPTDLAAAVTASRSADYRLPRIKLGHVDPEPGSPAIGFVTRLRTVDQGHTLVGDLEGIPADLARRLPTEFPDRSIEGVFTADGAGFVLTGLALLGAEQPAVGGMTSLRGLTVAASHASRSHRRGRWVSN